MGWKVGGYSGFGFSRPMVYQFMLMTACTIFKGWHDYPLYGRLYCYDNVWADTLMNQGVGKINGGYWSYNDPFTWEGYAQAWIRGIMWGNIKTFIKNTIITSIFIVWYLANDDMVWCFPGETIKIGTIDGC